jgi:hypothetical protein
VEGVDVGKHIGIGPVARAYGRQRLEDDGISIQEKHGTTKDKDVWCIQTRQLD